MTLGDRVEDVFIVDGAALTRPRSQMQFERDILDALAGDEVRQQAA
ncbi:PII uridylyl-transferase [Achromobacter sp. 2789STDY5608615]|nr:PII uridylyl-transferase [Achromobacter sp. 2789STDY5608615]